MSTPTQEPRKGIPVERILITLSIAGALGLIFMGTRTLFSTSPLTFSTIPIAGEWQSKDKPWHITFRADKTFVSSGRPSQSEAAQEYGTYSVNYFGTLWVKLGNGKLYSAELSPATPNRFDLIEMDTEVPTVFERVQPLKSPDSKG
jgi:hypothetical protein